MRWLRAKLVAFALWALPELMTRIASRMSLLELESSHKVALAEEQFKITALQSELLSAHTTVIEQSITVGQLEVRIDDLKSHMRHMADVPFDLNPIYERAQAICLEIDKQFKSTSGEYRFHQCLSRMMDAFPERKELDLSIAIQLAVKRLRTGNVWDRPLE